MGVMITDRPEMAARHEGRHVMAANPRRSVNAATALAHEHGFRTRESDLRDINNTVVLNVEGHGEWIEVTYRPSEAGYLRFSKGFIHNDHGGGDRLTTWEQCRRMIASFVAHDEEQAHDPSTDPDDSP